MTLHAMNSALSSTLIRLTYNTSSILQRFPQQGADRAEALVLDISDDEVLIDEDADSPTASEEAAGATKAHTVATTHNTESVQKTEMDATQPCETNAMDRESRASPHSTKKPLRKTLFQGKVRSRGADNEAQSLMKVMKHFYEKEIGGKNDDADLDEIGSFCQYIDRQLRQIPARKDRLTVQHEIQNVFFQYEMSAGMQQSNIPGPSSAYVYSHNYGYDTYTAASSRPSSKTAATSVPVQTPSSESVADARQKSLDTTLHDGSSATGTNKYTELSNVSMMTTRQQMRKKTSSIVSPSSICDDTIYELQFENM